MQLKYLMIIPLLTFVNSLAMAADAQNGEKLLKTSNVQCNGDCHEKYSAGKPAEAIYTRKNRKATDLNTLTNIVTTCNERLAANWWDEEIADVVEYLNKEFYKF